jgi:hypothetical protein
MNGTASGGVGVGTSVRVSVFRPRDSDCLELYLPKKLSHLSAFYDDLRRRLEDNSPETTKTFPITGFSIYEVDGAWRDDQGNIYDERSLVVRPLLDRTEQRSDAEFQDHFNKLAHEIASVAKEEKAIMICHYSLRKFTLYTGPTITG